MLSKVMPSVSLGGVQLSFIPQDRRGLTEISNVDSSKVHREVYQLLRVV